MPKIDITKAVVRTASAYPAPFAKVVAGRAKSALGDVAGLTQFGVNRTRLAPGAASALRHWHDSEDEFIYVLEGEVALIEDEGATVLKAGDAAGFKAGFSNGHHLVNRSNRDAVYLEIGTRAAHGTAYYPDDDLALRREGGKLHFTRKSGKPY
jgi:uncharacterized cupin superfamily protein